MLLRFSVSNWMSFRDQATLDMVATREKQHPHHVIHVAPLDLRLLPVAAIYGGNASGKSNLIKALRFVEQFITDPPKPDAPIPVKPFRLDRSADNRPSTFAISLLAQDYIYEYNFSLNAQRVLREELKRFGSTQELIFRRESEPENFILSAKVEDRERQMFAFHGTQDNQLFLTNSISQKLTEFKPVFDWFDNLRLVFPESSFGDLMGITDEDHPLHARIVARLHNLDSGIASLRQTKIPAESALPKALLENLSVNLEDGQTVNLGAGLSFRKENGLIIGRRLTPIHKNERGEEVSFSLNDESDGTQRLFDVLPAFLFLEQGMPFIFVVDELDRSLHSLLTEELLRTYLALNRRGSSRAQLIFTTHDMQLMTQEIFRRDEVWITERDHSGASKLVAFSEFKDVRNDKDIRKSYLQGRMGGIPRIQSITSPCEEAETQ